MLRLVGMTIAVLLLPTAAGVFSGFIWVSVLGLQIRNELIFGGTVGLIIGAVFGVHLMLSSSDPLQDKEKMFVFGSFISVLFVIFFVITLVVGLIKRIGVTYL